MDRYQFEDAISAYLDNELNLSDRQAFESYMNANPDAKALVNDIRATMKAIKSMPKVKASSTFCLLYTSPSPRDVEESRMPSSA